jgi:hypothetical protein
MTPFRLDVGWNPDIPRSARATAARTGRPSASTLRGNEFADRLERLLGVARDARRDAQDGQVVDANRHRQAVDRRIKHQEKKYRVWTVTRPTRFTRCHYWRPRCTLAAMHPCVGTSWERRGNAVGTRARWHRSEMRAARRVRCKDSGKRGKRIYAWCTACERSHRSDRAF